MECMNCKGSGCINCYNYNLVGDPPDLVERGEGPDTLPTAIVLYDPDLRPEQFDGVPADNR